MTMTLFLIIFGIFWLTSLTWIFYLAIMNLKKEKKNLRLGAKILGYPMLILGFFLDVMFNIIVGSIMFLEFPRIKELLFTARVSRHNDSPTWRGNVARWFCTHLLDQFDPSGKHCS